MRGRLVDLAFSRTRKQRITIEIDGDFRDCFDLLNGEELDIEIKKHRKKRSLSANAYAWVLIDKIADVLQQDKETVYRQAIQQIGGVSEIVCVKNQAVAQLCRGWKHNGIGWSTDTMPSKIPGCTNVILYYGSSVYDTKQMSNLLEYLVQEAKELGIETDTPEQISRYKEQWNR